MSLEDWANNGWLRRHETSRQEIADLLAIVDRDLADAGGNISPDWRFGIAYNGALKLCTILLHASGYRPEKTLQHYRAITAMPMILGAKRKDDADYLDRCRRKRNIAEYDRTDVVTERVENGVVISRVCDRTWHLYNSTGVWSGRPRLTIHPPRKFCYIVGALGTEISLATAASF